MDPTATLTTLIDSLETRPEDTEHDRERALEDALQALADLTQYLEQGDAFPDVVQALEASGYVPEEEAV